jgi:hypothetical protein
MRNGGEVVVPPPELLIPAETGGSVKVGSLTDMAVQPPYVIGRIVLEPRTSGHDLFILDMRNGSTRFNMTEDQLASAMSTNKAATSAALVPVHAFYPWGGWILVWGGILDLVILVFAPLVGIALLLTRLGQRVTGA